MAALPLTLDTLKSTSNESLLSQQSPLLSPQYLKADSVSSSNEMDTIPGRPSNLTLDSIHQQQQQQQPRPQPEPQPEPQPHSNVNPSLTKAPPLHGNISPALSSADSLSPSFLPEMPQWKRDLIQRRKQNVQRTLSASSPISSSSSSSALLSSSPTVGGLKTSISSSSVRSLVGSNTNIDQFASDGLQQQQVYSTKDYTKTSLLPFGSATTKVNKQYITTTGTNTLKPPATNIKSSTIISSSPLKEKAEKLFGGQYTATTSSSSSSTLATKEEITTRQQRQYEVLTNKEWKGKIPQENNKMLEENEEEHFEMYRKTKEALSDETQTTTAAIITSKQQMATRLTGSTYNNNITNTSAASSSPSPSLPSSSSSSILRRVETEREKLLTTTQQHNSIIGANVNIVNQSLNKCESERFVSAASNTNAFSAGNTNSFNANDSVTIGGISVSGSISNNQNNCSSVVKISQKLQENQFIKNEQHLNTKKFIKFKQNTSGGNISLDLKSPTKISNELTTSSSTSCLTSSSSSSSCAIKKKMVAVQEMKKSTQGSATHLHPITSTCHATNRGNTRGGGGVGGGGVGGRGDADIDNSEDLSYGPGIVSKLRCRYLSLALRESMEQQRLNKDQLRRSTSLNNLLDNTEDEENCDEDEDDEEEADEMGSADVENQVFDYKAIRTDPQNVETKKAGILKTSVNNCQEKRFTHNSQGSNGVGVTFTETTYNKRSRHLKRGNDSLKRARSVEALLSEKSPWHTRVNSSGPSCVTIEDKIHNARERLQQGSDHMPPKRLSSIIDDTERPPPDLVKQTLKMFEATANRRPRSTNRSNSKGDVASKVETFKNIIKEQKPVVSFPKPLSPTKKLNTATTQKPSKPPTPHAKDLLQSPLGRKTMAAATSVNNTNDCLTPLKTNNTPLSDRTPDIIPRQKFNIERDFKQGKEIFSSKEKFLSDERGMESPLSNIKRDYFKEKFEVDSPITALSKEFANLKTSDMPTRKNDNFSVNNSSDNQESVNNVGGGVGGVGGGDNNGDDACQRHNTTTYTYNNSNNDFVNEEITQKELNFSSLKNENDKINNKTKPNSNNEATSSSPFSTTIETKNEATVNSYDSSTKTSSPPPSSSDLSDVGENYDDEEYGGLKTTKRITRTALDNIAKAGYTQQFKFNTTNNTNSSSSTSTSVSNSTSSPLNTGKQIGVIRPLLNTQQQQQQQQQKSADTNMATLKHSSTTSLTSREIEKNRINDLKKSSTSSPINAAATSSPSSASLDHQVIKPTHTSSPAMASTASSSNLAAGFAEVDSVISATNSPLWAMRKRRQTPPAAPAENTSMVFNFSNRKEVPDYIENDGVIFRRKRELPKPNESGFVLLGDLSVETSTDLDYDMDFSMCPPSPCDVEFVNANIVIDGKSSIRQKSKDITFHVQFNDTLTSTFEYPSEASLIVDESFSAYNESYTQPLGSSSLPDDFIHAFQDLNIGNNTHHHVADEIIQLPTLNASSPPAATTNTNSPTKNILGNLPLDYPVLQKGIQLTTATASLTSNATASSQMTPEDSQTQQQSASATDKKKSRKDLKLPLDAQRSLQKPPLPVKRFQILSHPAAVAGVPTKLLNSKVLAGNLVKIEKITQKKETPISEEGDQQQQKQQQQPSCYKDHFENDKTNTKAELPLQRKAPRVLNNPQYACFLQETTPHVAKPIQRSRSNEFQNTFNTLSVSATVSRSNSLRNLKYLPANIAHSQFTPSEVISTDKSNNLSKNEMAKDTNAFKTPLAISQAVNNNALESPSSTPKNTLETNTFPEIDDNNKRLNEEPDERAAQSLNNLAANSKNCLDFKENISRSVDNLSFRSLENLKEKRENFAENSEKIKVTDVDEKIKNTLTDSSTENSLPVETQENPKHMASLDFQLNDVKSNLSSLTKDATDNYQNSGDFWEGKPLLHFQGPRCQNSSKANSVKSLNNSLESTENRLIIFNNNDRGKLTDSSTKSVGIISLTVNSKYVTDYRSKITKNLPPLAFKSAENLTSQNIIEKKQKSRDNQSKSHDHLAERGALKLDLPGNSISNDNFSDIIEYSLYRNIKTLNSGGIKAEVIDEPANSPENLLKTQNFGNISKSADDIVKIDSVLMRNFLENRSKSVENLQTSENFIKDLVSNSIDSKDDDGKNLLAPQKKPLENQNFGELKTESNLESKSDNTALSESVNSGTITNDDSSITISNKSLQISRDSLDNFEDAEESKEEKLLTNLEASEILEDIAVGFDNSLFDFNSLRTTLKKSKTAYCLQSLEKFSSLESEGSGNSLPGDDSNFLSACNTLESKCPLKHPREIPIIQPSESSDAKPKHQGPSEKPKTFRVKTTEKILNLTNMASQNVSNFQKSKNFYKNASKSFKNSLRFYESFSEKNSQSTKAQSSIKRSASLIENPLKKADLSRKMFSKSSKIMMKVRNIEEWDSPTENSYSFEYFDAEGDLNRNLNNADNNANNGIIIDVNGNFNQNLRTNLEKQQTETGLSDLRRQVPKETLNEEILVSQKSMNLKPISSDFYFNTSPRPFKRTYEATTTVVDMGISAQRATESEDGKNLIEKSITLQGISNSPEGGLSIPTTAALGDSNTFSKDLTLTENRLNYSVNPNPKSSSTFTNTTPMVINSTTISLLSRPTVLFDYSSPKRANSFSKLNDKSLSNISVRRTKSFNAYTEHISRNLETFNRKPEYNRNFRNNKNTVNFPNNFSKCSSNSQVKTCDNTEEVSDFQKTLSNAEKSGDSSEFSFNVTNFSANCPQFSDKYSDNEFVCNISVNSLPNMMDPSSKNIHSGNKSSACYPSSNVKPLFQNFNIKKSDYTKFSSNSLKLSKFDKHSGKFNVTPATTFTPIATLTAQDFNHKTTTKFSTIPTTPTTTTTTATTTITTTTTTTTITPSPTAITNFSTQVVATANPKPSNISYINSSFSLRTSKKFYATAKYHQNQKATTIATATTKTTTTTTTTTFNRAPPPLKNIKATINPPKVLPRRCLFVNAPKTATTPTTVTAIKTTTTTTTTTTTCNTTSSTISSTCFKASSITASCTSANNNVPPPPLRRRIPGNTLYYV